MNILQSGVYFIKLFRNCSIYLHMHTETEVPAKRTLQIIYGAKASRASGWSQYECIVPVSAGLSMPEIAHRCWSVAGKELCWRQYPNIFRLLLTRHSLKLIIATINWCNICKIHTQNYENNEIRQRAPTFFPSGLDTCNGWQISCFSCVFEIPLELVE